MIHTLTHDNTSLYLDGPHEPYSKVSKSVCLAFSFQNIRKEDATVCLFGCCICCYNAQCFVVVFFNKSLKSDCYLNVMCPRKGTSSPPQPYRTTENRARILHPFRNQIIVKLSILTLKRTDSCDVCVCGIFSLR